jgi:chromosome segregation ATPase
MKDLGAESDKSHAAPLDSGGIRYSMDSQEQKSKDELRAKIEQLTGAVEHVSDQFESNLKRVLLASLAIILCSVIFLLVAGGRLASQVDLLQATTVSLAKRVVNMNSALDVMTTFDQKLLVLDQGNAEVSLELSRFDAENRGAIENLVKDIEGLTVSVVSLDQNINSVIGVSNKIGESLGRQSEQIARLGGRINQLEQEFENLEVLSNQVELLIQIERDNLKELFEAKLELQRSQSQTEDREVSSNSATDDDLLNYQK